MMSNMKVCLTFPRVWKKGIQGGVHPPLGILYLAAGLRSAGISCEVLDYFRHGRDAFFADMERLKPEFLAVSMTSPSAQESLDLIREVKRRWPKTVTLCGGPHVHHDARELAENTDIDVIVRGEGDVRIVDLVRSYPHLDELPGVIFRKNGALIETPDAASVACLDELPFPARDMIDMPWYIRSAGSITLISSRGCPYQCIYCQPTQRKVFGAKIRRRSVSDVIAEMKSLKEQYSGDWLFYFEDDSFTSDKAWLKSFCDELLSSKLRYRWSCHSRVNDVDAEKMRLMKKAGLEIIYFGVESGSQKTLDFMKKGTTVEQVRNAFKHAHRNRVLAHAFLMIGTPTETTEDLAQTEALVREIHPDVVQISRTTPMIGSKLYEHCRSEGISNVKDYSDYEYCMNRYPIQLESLSEGDLDNYERRILKAFHRGRIRNIPKYVYMLLFQRNRLRRIRSFLGIGPAAVAGDS